MTLSEWRLKMTENVEATLKRIGKGADNVTMKVANFQDKLNRVDGGNLKKNLGRSFEGVSNTLGSAGLVIPGLGMGGSLLTASIGAGILIAGKGVQAALSYEEALAKVNATAQLTGSGLEDMDSKIKQIARDGKSSYIESALSYEKILSQTNDLNQSYDILRASLKGAKAGFAENEVVAAALAQTMSSIGDKNIKAEKVLDTLFAAKRYGAGEFADFARYLPGLTAMGKNVGIDYKENASIFSYFTSVGNSAERANMLVENFYTTLGRPEFTQGLMKLKINPYDAQKNFRPIQDIITDLSKKLAGLKDKPKQLILKSMLELNDAQAKTAIASLLTDAGKLKTTFDGINSAVGETNRQFDLTENRMRTLKGLGESLKNLLVDFGTALINADKLFKRAFRKQGFENLNPDDKKTQIQLWKDASGGQNDFDHTIKNPFQKFSSDVLGGKPMLTVSEIAKQWAQKSKNVSPLKEKDNPLNNFNDSKTKYGIDSIHGGGTQTRNVYVTIHKVVDGGITVHTATLKEGIDKIEPTIAEGLLRIINGAEQSLMTN